jgi:hypothetical protein
MKKITKKQIRQIKWGNHAVLMECITFLLDSFNEDMFGEGYKSCLSDMSVQSQRLAGYIIKHTSQTSKDKEKPIKFFYTPENLQELIEEYFREALNE